MKKTALLILCLLPFIAFAQTETSVAGFFHLKDSGREIYKFNPGWRFDKGDIKGAEATGFDGSSGEIASTHNTVELRPKGARGGRK